VRERRRGGSGNQNKIRKVENGEEKDDNERMANTK